LQENEIGFAPPRFQRKSNAHLLRRYLPGHEHNYSHTIGPIEWDIPESDKRIGDFNIGRQLGDGSIRKFRLSFALIDARMKQFALKKLNKDRYINLPRLDSA
jgi:hypothetical protein